MTQASSRSLELDQKGVVLLDEALRTAYTRLIDTGVLKTEMIAEIRDVLVGAIVPALLQGETDCWRLARRGIFMVCGIIAAVD